MRRVSDDAGNGPAAAVGHPGPAHASNGAVPVRAQEASERGRVTAGGIRGEEDACVTLDALVLRF